MDIDLVGGLQWYLVFVFSTSWHEAAHAWVAHKLGDSTAYHGGQVSLDPTPHIRREPLGMVVVPILSFLLGGWMIGWASAPYDPRWASEYPRRAVLMALAGPAANLLIVLIAAVLMRVGFGWDAFSTVSDCGFDNVVIARGGVYSDFFASTLSVFFSLNLLLFVFNLLPVSPLDGSNIPFLFLSPKAAETYREAVSSPGFRMVGLVVAWQIFGPIFGPIFGGAVDLLYRFLPG